MSRPVLFRILLPAMLAGVTLVADARADQPPPSEPQPPAAPEPAAAAPREAVPAPAPAVAPPARRPAATPSPYPPAYRRPYPPAYGRPYPPPYGYAPYQPPPAAPRKPQPPGVIPGWDPDTPVPDGYRLDSSPHGGMLALGITLFSVSWVGSAAAVPVLLRDEDDRGIDGDGVEGKDWLPLLIPVAGPFVTIDSVKSSPAGTAILVIDGVAQSVGLTLLVAGILVRRHRAIRIPTVALAVEPVVGPHYRGIGLSGAF